MPPSALPPTAEVAFTAVSILGRTQGELTHLWVVAIEQGLYRAKYVHIPLANGATRRWICAPFCKAATQASNMRQSRRATVLMTEGLMPSSAANLLWA